MELSKNDKAIVSGIQRELVLGTGLKRMDVPASYSSSDVEMLVKKITSIPETSEVQLDCAEIKLLRNMCCDLLRELDDFEFHARIGYTPDEVFELYKRIKKAVDTICY